MLTYDLDTLTGNGTAGRYHLTNLGLHLLTGVVLFLLAALMNLSPFVQLTTAAVFLLHPLHSEAVLYISDRADILMALFIILGCVALLSRHAFVRLLAVPAYFLAILGKESAVTGIVLYGLLLLYQGRSLTFDWRALINKRVPLLLLTICGCLYTCYWIVHEIVVVRAGVLADYQSPSGVLDYAVLQATALWSYTGMVFIPFGLTIDHDFELTPHVIQYGLGVLLVLSTLVLLYVYWVKRDLLSFGLLWAVLAIIPRFIIRIPEVLNEHQMYLSMVGYSLAVAYLLALIFQQDVVSIRHRQGASV